MAALKRRMGGTFSDLYSQTGNDVVGVLISSTNPTFIAAMDAVVEELGTGTVQPAA